MEHLTAQWPQADYSALWEGILPTDNLHDGVRAVVAARLSRMIEAEPALEARFPEPAFNPAWKLPARDWIAAEALGVAVITVNRTKSVLKRASIPEIAMVISGEVDVFTLWAALKAQRQVRGRKKKEPHKRPRVAYEPRKPIAHLTPAQVDPEFKGSAIEFVDKYGHVQTETAEQRARRRFGEWAQNMRSIAKTLAKLPDWPKVDIDWLRSPRLADIEKLEKALTLLLPHIREAEDLLIMAQLVYKEKADGNTPSSEGVSDPDPPTS